MKKIFDWFAGLEKDKVLHDDIVCTISLLFACICRMFNGGGFGTMPMPKLEEKDFKTEIENKAE